jgi:hypothetical protein
MLIGPSTTAILRGRQAQDGIVNLADCALCMPKFN